MNPTKPRSRFAPYNPSAFAAPGDAPRQLGNTQPQVQITFTIDEEVAPALKSAIEEISNEVGGRLEAPHSYDREDALTRAARALGALRAAVSAVVPQADPNYSPR